MKTLSLGDICELRYGSSLPEQTRRFGKVPVFGSNGQVGLHSEALTDGPTIVVGRKGSIGKVNFTPEPCWPIDTTYFVDSSTTKEDIRWLAYALSSLRLDELNKATGVPGLNRNDAYQKQLCVPPLAEQRRIAAILDQADALRRKRREALARLEELRRSVFDEMFGDPVLNPKNWERKKAEALCERITVGIVVKPASYYRERGIPAIRGTNIKASGIDLSDVVFVSKEDNSTKLRKTRIWKDDLIIVRRLLPQAPGLRWVVTRAGAWGRNIT